MVLESKMVLDEFALLDEEKLCTQCKQAHISVYDPTKYYVTEGKVQPHCNNLSKILSSPISLRASTSELLVAFPVFSHECSMAVLHFSTSPPLLLSMLSRREYSIPSARPSSCQSVRPRRLLLMENRLEASRRALNKISSYKRSSNKTTLIEASH